MVTADPSIVAFLCHTGPYLAPGTVIQSISSVKSNDFSDTAGSQLSGDIEVTRSSGRDSDEVNDRSQALHYQLAGMACWTMLMT